MTVQKHDRFNEIMLAYYSFEPLRIMIKAVTFICQITLSLYIMVIPLQLAYHSIVSEQQYKHIQDIVDYIVVIIFSIHLYLYFDDSIEKMIKKPNSQPKYTIKMLGKWTRIVTIQLLFDIGAWILSVYMAIPENNSLAQRYVQLIFILKVYKLYKFHKRTIFLLIGSVFYPIYKVFFTIIVVFIAIAFLSSIFFAMDQIIIQNEGPFQALVWQANVGTQPNLINQSLEVKILLANYWALGTASTAAYGDVSAFQPQQVIFNIFVLFFAGFLYGFYVNNINSIPLQTRQQQSKILQRFNQLQKHSKQTKQETQQNHSQPMQNQLYLKIICSLQYKQKQRADFKRTQQVIPIKYLQQIKFQIYKRLLFFSNFSIGNSSFFKEQSTAMKIARTIKVSVCEKNQNIYQSQGISYSNLVYIHEGSVKLQLRKQLKKIISFIKLQGQIFGTYNFITNSQYPLKAVALTYVSVYLINREQYKKCLTIQEAKQFNHKFTRCLDFTQQKIQTQIYKRYQQLLQDKNSQLSFIRPQVKCKKVQIILNKRKNIERKQYQRQNLKSKKISLIKKNKKKDAIVQTQSDKQNWTYSFQQILDL